MGIGENFHIKTRWNVTRPNLEYDQHVMLFLFLLSFHLYLCNDRIYVTIFVSHLFWLLTED